MERLLVVTKRTGQFFSLPSIKISMRQSPLARADQGGVLKRTTSWIVQAMRHAVVLMPVLAIAPAAAIYIILPLSKMSIVPFAQHCQPFWPQHLPTGRFQGWRYAKRSTDELIITTYPFKGMRAN